MAIHYHKASGRFRDDSGRFVSKAKAWRSSIARREYHEAHAEPAPPVEVESPRVLPWEVDGFVKEYPDPDEWFDDEAYGYEDLLSEWGDFSDEGTDS